MHITQRKPAKHKHPAQDASFSACALGFHKLSSRQASLLHSVFPYEFPEHELNSTFEAWLWICIAITLILTGIALTLIDPFLLVPMLLLGSLPARIGGTLLIKKHYEALQKKK